MSAMLRLSLAFKESKESLYAVLNSLGAKNGVTRSRLDKRLGGGSAAMLATLSSSQLSQNDKLLHAVSSSILRSQHYIASQSSAAGCYLPCIFFV
jgi:hypothetical protein